MTMYCLAGTFTALAVESTIAWWLGGMVKGSEMNKRWAG
jgi:hypothetical protein